MAIRSVSASVLAVAACVAFAACDPSPAPAPAPSATADPAFVSLVTETYEAALGEGADPSQLALLEQARDEGAMSFDLYRQAATLMTDCFDAAGLTWEAIPPDALAPFPELLYQVFFTEDGDDLLMAACQERFFDHVAFVYSLQPTAIDAVDAKFEQVREPLLACIREHGRAIDQDATPDAMRDALYYLRWGVERGISPEEAPAGWEPIDCSSGVGLESY